MSGRFADRRAAGRMLARELEPLCDSGPIVLALPRGGVPVAFEVARVLQAPLDVVIVRKIGMPGHEEFGVGALVLTFEPQVVLDEDLLRRFAPNPAAIERIVDSQLLEARRRQKLYRGDRPLPLLKGRTVILVDDGLATGGTARAALRAIRREQPGFLILAVPVGSPDSVARLQVECDLIVCPVQPDFFGAVGAFYDDFGQTEDAEVLQLLKEAAQWQVTAA